MGKTVREVCGKPCRTIPTQPKRKFLNGWNYWLWLYSIEIICRIFGTQNPARGDPRVGSSPTSGTYKIKKLDGSPRNPKIMNCAGTVREARKIFFGRVLRREHWTVGISIAEACCLLPGCLPH